jgi:hypothetical protein
MFGLLLTRYNASLPLFVNVLVSMGTFSLHLMQNLIHMYPTWTCMLLRTKLVE